MGWDSEFFVPRNNVFRNQNKPIRKRADEKNKFVICSDCNQPIGIVSITLYEIDEKNYCSECYFRKIANEAVERDHFDLKHQKKR